MEQRRYIIIIRKLYYSLSFSASCSAQTSVCVVTHTHCIRSRTHPAIEWDGAAPGFKFNFAVQDEWATNIPNYLVSGVSNFLLPCGPHTTQWQLGAVAHTVDFICHVTCKWSKPDALVDTNIEHDVASHTPTQREHHFICSALTDFLLLCRWFFRRRTRDEAQSQCLNVDRVFFVRSESSCNLTEECLARWFRTDHYYAVTFAGVINWDHDASDEHILSGSFDLMRNSLTFERF